MMLSRQFTTVPNTSKVRALTLERSVVIKRLVVDPRPPQAGEGASPSTGSG
jgi:hypothetical protein